MMITAIVTNQYYKKEFISWAHVFYDYLMKIPVAVVSVRTTWMVPTGTRMYVLLARNTTVKHSIRGDERKKRENTFFMLSCL